MKDTTKVFLGFAAGVAVTAGLVALSKTEKGQEVISDLEKRAKKLKKGMDEMVDKGKHVAEDLAKKFNGAPKETPVA